MTLRERIAEIQEEFYIVARDDEWERKGEIMKERVSQATTAILEAVEGELPKKAFTDYPNTPLGLQAKHENQLFNSAITEMQRKLK